MSAEFLAAIAEADDEWIAERRSHLMGWLRRRFRAQRQADRFFCGAFICQGNSGPLGAVAR